MSTTFKTLREVEMLSLPNPIEQSYGHNDVVKIPLQSSMQNTVLLR